MTTGHRHPELEERIEAQERREHRHDRHDSDIAELKVMIGELATVQAHTLSLLQSLATHLGMPNDNGRA